MFVSLRKVSLRASAAGWTVRQVRNLAQLGSPDIRDPRDSAEVYCYGCGREHAFTAMMISAGHNQHRLQLLQHLLRTQRFSRSFHLNLMQPIKESQTLPPRMPASVPRLLIIRLRCFLEKAGREALLGSSVGSFWLRVGGVYAFIQQASGDTD